MKTKKQYMDEVMQTIGTRTYFVRRHGIDEDSVYNLLKEVQEIIGEDITNPAISHVGIKLIFLLGGHLHEVDPSFRVLALDYFLEYATLIYEEAERIIKIS